MKKLLFLFLTASLLASCGSIPEAKYNTAKYCVDSLSALGAEVSFKFRLLEIKMNAITKKMDGQRSLLFKKKDQLKEIENELNTFINDARHFIITDDRPTLTTISTSDYNKSQSKSSLRLEVELDFDSPVTSDESLKIAADIDDAVRRILNAKLVRVKVIQ